MTFHYNPPESVCMDCSTQSSRNNAFRKLPFSTTLAQLRPSTLRTLPTPAAMTHTLPATSQNVTTPCTALSVATFVANSESGNCILRGCGLNTTNGCAQAIGKHVHASPVFPSPHWPALITPAAGGSRQFAGGGTMLIIKRD
jgi:hypothetical protein